METRGAFAAELDAIAIEYAAIADLIDEAVRSATDALLDEDQGQLDEACRVEADVIGRTRLLDQRCGALLLLQNPAAADHRLVVSMIRLAAELDRSAHLAGNIARQAEVVRGRTLPDPLPEVIRSTARRVREVYRFAVTGFRTYDLELAASVAQLDDAVDQMTAELTEIVVAAGDAGSLSALQVVRLGLLARYLERIADHAVTMAERTIYVTGSRRT